MPSLNLIRSAAIALSCAFACSSTQRSPAAEAAPNSLYASQDTGALFEELIETSEIIQPLGLIVVNIHDFEGDKVREAKMQHNLGDRLQVLAIAPGSLAEQLGLEPGDIIMELNGTYVPKGKDAKHALKTQVIPILNLSGEIEATIIRNGYAQSLQVSNPSISLTAGLLTSGEG